MSDASLHVARARGEKRQQAEAIGIDPDLIARLVETFYGKVRGDAVLGPIFEARIADWPHHLGRMKGFWGSVLYESGGFSGNPMLKHVAIPAIAEPEFNRWLDLFDQALAEIGTQPDAAKLIALRARSIAASLLMGIRIHRDGRRDPLALKGLDHVQ